ncbi:nickel import ATP-binding protein NikD [Vibrio mangrovi]|uniref:Nickel import ATP-binding protein NikD n=1 Tax=Vibrio mangrovi TaxID=474394 RepID=A0A1Y6ITY8_9VIBR|nr:nickel import ATP-binding protein NikD [Vibrio mangrovi]MDW6004848.1 nickel import ATP-binding protein NikD [Vibrio mangrovi]SMS01139.1 Nickel import ATP-binding protein NikD [Vibrio mangrovi]
MAKQLTLEHITVLAGTQPLVRDVSLSVRSGEIVALIGASGSGKSLTCSAALGVLSHGLQMTQGRILLDHQAMQPDELRGHVVSTIMQNPRSAFNPVHTMLQHGIETLRITTSARQTTAQDTIVQAMREAGLENPETLLKLYPHEMSGGMLQRMMIALTMLSHAPFLFADEPTTDLDLVMQARILELLHSLIQQQKLGMLLVTHDMGVVARLAHRVMVMSHGEIIEHASVEEIFTNPQHAVTRELVNAHLSLYDMELTNDMEFA